MPNWSAGCLKVRGSKQNIIDFVLQGLEPCFPLGEDYRDLQLDEYNCVRCKSNVRVKGTHRGFIESLEFWPDDLNENEPNIVCFDFMQAWAIEAQQLLAICRQYNLDMKIYSFEMGMKFNQDIEIVDGKIIKDDEIKFDDYRWECICPEEGG